MPSSNSGTSNPAPHHPGRPWEGRYGAMLPAAVMSLVPFIITTVAWDMFRKGMAKEVGAKPGSLELALSLSTAGYAFGALMGGDIIQRFPQRRLFLILETCFVLSCIVSATAQGVWQLSIGLIAQGLVTGLLLVVALPPVVRRFPAGKMPITAAAINMGFFGAITAGPLVGGAVALAHLWRWYFASLAVIGLLVLLVAALSLPDQAPFDPGRPFDWHAVLLALAATVLPFYASGILQQVGFGGFQFSVILGVGLLCFAALILAEYHKKDALSPVKPMWHTWPVLGTLIAMFGGGIFVSLLDLGLRYATKVEHLKPLAAGIAFWPMLPAIVFSALLLALAVRSRWIPIFILSGMMALVAAAALFARISTPDAHGLVSAAAVLLGYGAGATVSPGLWLAGFSLPSKMVGRIFSLVELVRSVADFVLAPVILELMHVGSAGSAPTPQGVASAAWYVLLIAAACTGFAILLYLSGSVSLPRPDLVRWLSGDDPALESPQFFGAFRG